MAVCAARGARAEPMIAQAESGWKDGWYVVPYRVIFRDLDSFGHVNNAVFLTYFEIARTQLWFELTGGRHASDVGFIVARAECDFRQQLTMESIEIGVRVGEMRGTSFDFVYEIWKSIDHSVAATGKVIVVLYDWKNRTKVAIPDDLRNRVRESQAKEG